MSNDDFYKTICARECRNTHHKLVMNSLQHLTCADAEQWRALFMRYFEHYLQGSKDPDTKFKDFRNHVLHVSDNFWGGPVKQAKKWYAATIDHLQNERWKPAVYSAGVLSHYYMDPIMPLHTGQTEQEGVIHRACEWSVNKSFQNLIDMLEIGDGYPEVDLPAGNEWLKTAIHDGATIAHEHYQAFIDHYNIQLGSKNPPAGLDSHLREVTSQLLGYASVGFARILERAFDESSAQPPATSTGWLKMLCSLTAPVSWAYKSYRHRSTRSRVKKIAKEYQIHGKVIRALPADEKAVRKLHADEILKIDIAELDAQEIAPVGAKSTAATSMPLPTSRSQTSRKSNATFRLNLNDPLEDAPSIGAKTAARFEAANIVTVADFLNADPVMTAMTLNSRHITAETIKQWQTQTKLACRIPRIYGHDAQILVGCGFESPEEIAQSEPDMVLSLVDDFAQTQQAKFIMRGKKPDLDEVTNWIEWSKQSRALKAA